MLLIDVIYAVHCDFAPTYSTNELIIKLPSTRHQFSTVYNSLTHGFTLSHDIKNQEDALLLLTALLSDVLYIQRCQLSLPGISDHQPHTWDDNSSREHKVLYNPYSPLSSMSEFPRLQSEMAAALARWEKHFHGVVENNVLALYYFTKLQLSCPEIRELPRMAGYGVANGFKATHIQPKQFDIPDQTMDLAWLVLDHCDKSSRSGSAQLSIWFPAVLFMSALVIWHRLQPRVAIDRSQGTLRMLGPFRNEIARLPWPCCVGMARTLDQLMDG